MSAFWSPRGFIRSMVAASGRARPARFGAESLEQRMLLAAVSWDGDAGDNLWHSANNWSNNAVPTAADDVTISIAANPTILFNATTGARSVNSLVSDEALSFTGGTLTVVTTASNSATTSLGGGTLSGGTWSLPNGISATTSGGTLSNVQLTGDIVMSAASSFAVVSGTTRFTTARLQANGTNIRFANGYTMNDTIVAEGATTGTRLIYQNGNGSSTIGATGIVRLATGAGGNLQFSNGAGTMALTNNGLIVNEAAGRLLDFSINSLANTGTLQAIAGTVDVSSTTTNTGQLIGVTGVLQISGTLNNTALTQTMNATTGSWRLAGGTISGGTINTADGASLLDTSSAGTLANVQLNGELLMNPASSYVVLSGTTRFTNARLQGGNTNIRFANGYTLLDTVVAEGAATGARIIYSNGTGTSTIGATGVIRLASGVGANLQLSTGAGAFTLTNNGTIVNEAAGRTLDIQNTSLTNNGALTATAGTIDISPTNWTNTGTITLAASTVVNLGGTMNATGGIGTFNNAGGTINVTGTINNTGNTFTLNNSTGSWTMLGGSITGGTINTADGKSILASSSAGTIANVQLNGEILMSAASSYVVLSGTTRFTNARLQGSNTNIRLNNGYTLNDTIVAEGAATGTRIIYSNGTGTSTVGATGVIRLAAGSGAGLQLSTGAGAFTLINNGLISAEAAGRTLDFANTALTNNGTIQGTAGTIDIGNTPVTNYNAGTNTLTGGAWSFNNTNVTWTAATIRTIAAATSVTLGGTGTFAPFAQLTTNSGLLTINNGRSLTVTPQGGPLTNNGTISSTAGVGTLAGTYTLANLGTLTASGTGTLQVNSPGTVVGTVTPAAGGTVAFGVARNFTEGTLTGAGTIAFNNNAASTVSTTFNPASLATSNGGQVTSTADITVGSVSNAGAIVLGVNILTVTGDYNQTADGTLEVTIASLANRGTVDVGGNANLGGTMRVTYNGYTLVREDRTTLITTGGTVNGVFLVEALGGIQNVELPRLIYNAQSVEFVVYGAGDFDGDGFITGIDYDLFVQAFEAGDPRVDVDGDGFITGQDFDIFVLAFEQG